MDASFEQPPSTHLALLGKRHDGDALAYLTSIYKDPSKPENLRIDAAKVAIRYERPALSPIEQTPQTDFIPLPVRLKKYERQDKARKALELAKPTQANELDLKSLHTDPLGP
jgi:hypothetical protein